MLATFKMAYTENYTTAEVTTSGILIIGILLINLFQKIKNKNTAKKAAHNIFN
jgi:hypothetical protein